jgi:hypothetical protein
MGLAQKLGLKKEEPINNPNEAILKLTKGELEALIMGLGEATFKGKQVESVFKLAVKLQDELRKLQ